MHINIILNGEKKVLDVDPKTTILDLAKLYEISIPTLCHCPLIGGHTGVHNDNSCRICSVEVVGLEKLVTACSTLVKDRMIISTNSPQVLNIRRMILELLLSEHQESCSCCEKAMDCSLLKLAREFQTTQIRFQKLPLRPELANHALSVQKRSNKCILCHKCLYVCQEIQTVNLVTKDKRPIESIATADIDIASCTLCGQCAIECPTSALSQVNLSRELLDLLSSKKTVVGMLSPAAISGFREFFPKKDNSSSHESIQDSDTLGKIITGMKKLGFSYVFDQGFATDILTLEDAYLFLKNLGDKEKSKLFISSVCPSTVRFLKHHYPELSPYLSSTQTPESMFSKIIKISLAEELQKNPDEIAIVWVSSCLAKKTIAKRDGHMAISVHDLSLIFKEAHLNFDLLEQGIFSPPFHQASQSSTFSVFSGGVLDAVLKTAYELSTGNKLPEIEFIEIHGLTGAEVSQVEFPEGYINIARACGLNNIRHILEKIKKNEIDLQALELMACPLGCIAGPGLLPINNHPEILKRRQEAIYNLNLQKTVKLPHKNSILKKIYKKLFLRPGSPQALEALHQKNKE